jgi:hypothetical protein
VGADAGFVGTHRRVGWGGVEWSDPCGSGILSAGENQRGPTLWCWAIIDAIKTNQKARVNRKECGA